MRGWTSIQSLWCSGSYRQCRSSLRVIGAGDWLWFLQAGGSCWKHPAHLVNKIFWQDHSLRPITKSTRAAQRWLTFSSGHSGKRSQSSLSRTCTFELIQTSDNSMPCGNQIFRYSGDICTLETLQTFHNRNARIHDPALVDLAIHNSLGWVASNLGRLINKNDIFPHMYSLVQRDLIMRIMLMISHRFGAVPTISLYLIARIIVVRSGGECINEMSFWVQCGVTEASLAQARRWRLTLHT